MKIAFVDFHGSFYDRHWLYSLVAIARQFAKDLVWYDGNKSPAGLAKIKPDVILYSAFQCEIKDAIRFDAALHRPAGTVSVLGGFGPTFEPDCIEGTTIDALCMGEGDMALFDFLSSGCLHGRNIKLRGGKIESFASFVDLDALPFPNRDLLYGADWLLRTNPTKAFLSGRGCPYDCSYCFNHAYRELFKGCGKYVRQKSVAYIVEEIQRVKASYPLEFISFQDDTFILNPSWLEEFSRAYPKAIGLPFCCNVRANLLTDGIAKMLKAAGCRAVSWSIESGSKRVLDEVLRRRMTLEQIHSAAEVCGRNGLVFRNASIVGIPGETKEEVKETIRVNQLCGSAFSTANVFVPYPGLELTTKTALIENEELPANFFRASALPMSKRYKRFLAKTACLLPVFVAHRKAYDRAWIRGVLYAMPLAILRPAYELYYLARCKAIYQLRTKPWIAAAMAWRYAWKL